MSSTALSLPEMRHVTIEYENGMTITYEGAALRDWANVYYEALAALTKLRAIEAQVQALREQQSATASETTDLPSNVRSLREVLRKRAGDSD